MAKALAWTAVLLAAALGGCSPFGGNSAFNCTDNAQCNAGGAGAAGRCESTGFCSYADGSCPMGQRYGDNAGTNSGVCVGEEPKPDGGVDDMMVAKVCYGAANGLVKPCFQPAPTGDITLPNTINTTDSPLCSTTVTDVPNGLCVIAAERLTVPAGTVAVSGTRPLVLVASGTIEVVGILDAASHRNNAAPYMNDKTGPGAQLGPCNAGTPPGNSSGGAGGTLVALGGGGGNGMGGTGGVAGTAQTNPTFRGGCPGQDGVTGALGKGGRGGGAIYLIADSITISGLINASGEGGHPGINGNAGAGGGGSGGMIALDARELVNNGAVFANGGSGGEGSGMGQAGIPGPEPTGPAQSGAAIGGSVGGNGGTGGAGGVAGGTPTGGNGQNANNDGGGGGGGGTGVIKVYRITLDGQYSPNPTP